MEKNPLQLERERANPAGLIDLADTSFHANGLRFPQEPLRTLIDEYLATRSYQPDPHGAPAARRAICDYYARHGVAFDPQRIFITASTSESYALLFQSLAEAGDNVLLPSPTYPLFEFLAAYARLEVRTYEMLFDRAFRLDLAALSAQMDSRTRFVVLISPSNPTGRVATNAEVDALLDLCEERNLMLICDEVFSEFLYKGGNDDGFGELPRPSSRASRVPVFTLNGISKMFASPDLKLAWIAASGEDSALAEPLDRLETANDTFLNCSSLSQYLLPGLFERGREFQRAMVERLRSNRARLLSALAVEDERGSSAVPAPLQGAAGLRIVPPNGGIHCVLGVPRLAGGRWSDDEGFAVMLLREKGVYLHPGYFYALEEGPKELYVVVSFLKEPDALSEALRRLVSFLHEEHARGA